MEYRNRTLQVFIIGLAATAFAGGCGPGSDLDLAPVSGTVTYRGEPLSGGEGRVVFLPQKPTKGPQGEGLIQEDGTYTMSTANKAGAIVGTHKVTITYRRKISEQQKQALMIGDSLVPTQYTNPIQTPLEVTVEPGGQTYDIELQ